MRIVAALGSIGYGSLMAIAADPGPTPITQFPLQSVLVSCSFAATCDHPNHLGTDLSAVEGTQVYSPVDGVVKEARLATDYGGIVIIESQTADGEYVTHIVAHMYADRLSVSPKAGENVVHVGDLLGVVADYDHNGHYPPHVHWGTRKGRYSSRTGVCSLLPTEWTYAGYTLCPDIIYPTWYDAWAYTPARCVGCYGDASQWHTDDGSSSAFLAAYSRQRVALKTLDSPKEDAGNPQGHFVHAWGGSNGVFVQNFENDNFDRRGVILWRTGQAQAHTVRGGFWNQYRYSSGPDTYGAPLTDEGCWTDQNGTFYQAAQQFEYAIMKWNPSMGSQISVQTANVPAGVISTAPCGTVQAQGFTGSDEKTFSLRAQSVAEDQVVLEVANDGGLAYNTIRLYRNSLAAGDYPGSTTTIVDNGVSPNTQYEYRIEGRYNDWGTVSESEPINVTTPPSPSTFDLQASARDATTIDLHILDTIHPLALYNIYRDGSLVARTSGLDYSDLELQPETTYSYQGEAITASGLSLGWTSPFSVTTPENPDTSPPPPPPPPHRTRTTRFGWSTASRLRSPYYRTTSSSTAARPSILRSRTWAALRLTWIG